MHACGELSAGSSTAITDQVFLQDTFDLMAAVGNHEMKALSLIVLGAQSAFLNRPQLGSILQDTLKSANADWIPSVGTPFCYCWQSFEPIGQVVKGEVVTPKGITEAYSLSERGYALGLPLAGLVLDWSLRYPDISVQKVVGPTNSKGTLRAPHNRGNVLLQLLTHKDSARGLSLAELAELDDGGAENEAYHTMITNQDSAVRSLAIAGIVRAERARENNDRTYEITDPNFSLTVLRQANLNPITRHLHEFVLELHGADVKQFTFTECLDYLTQKMSGTDPVLIRAKLNQLISTSNPMDNEDIQRTLSISSIRSRDTFNDRAFTRVFLETEHAEAVANLVGIILAVEDEDKETLAYGRERALQIVVDPTAIKAVADKAYSFSAAAKKLPIAITEQRIVAILQNEVTALSADVIICRYEEAYGRRISSSSVRGVLNGLIKQGSVQLVRDRAVPTVKTLANYYKVSDSCTLE